MTEIISLLKYQWKEFYRIARNKKTRLTTLHESFILINSGLHRKVKTIKMKKTSTPFMLLLALLVSFNVYSLPKLSSLPIASATIFLDFDGHNVNSAVWQSGTPFTCAPSTMSDVQITEVFNRVSEDYRPFNINITTDSTVFLAAPLDRRMRVVITPTSAWYTGVGGVSYVGSFTWGDDTPCFVFCDRLGPNSAKMVAECCSHESGHTVGLSHQSKYDGSCNLTATYNDGLGSGEVAWAPIMGNSYYRNMSGWNNGPTPYGCTVVQDNLSIITSQNGFTYRKDDYTDDINSKPTAINISAIPVNGIITTSTDIDAFKITIAANSNFHIEINPFSIGANNQGADLDVKVSLYNAAKALVRTYDPEDKMNVVIDTILNSGDYYLAVQGAGNSNVSDYGSLGSYRISGVQGTLPIRQVSLTGKVDKPKHNLNWNIITDDPIKLITVESSTTGSNFGTVNTISGTANSFVYMPFQRNEIYYYRLKVTSILNQTVYSNTIVLKADEKTAQSFGVSTFVRNQITVTAADNYEYHLSDINGNTIAQGKGKQGFNQVNIDHQPAGMYILQLVSNNEKQTERIIKQ